MHKPHSERPKMPGLPRRRPEARHAAANPVGMPRTVPILPAKPEVKERKELRPTTRLSWSKSIVDQVQRGESLPSQPAYRETDVRPVRSQAALRARAGMAWQPVTPPVAPLPTPEISVNSVVSTPLPSELISELSQDEMSLPGEPTESAWTRIRKGFGSLLGAFRQG